MESQAKKIVLFDGVCNYCNSMVNFAIRHDPEGILKFTPLQSATGSQLRERYKIPLHTDSVIFIENDKLWFYSDAALHITTYLRPPANFFAALLIIPKIIREPVYKWIAKNRYRWFGKRESCMIPTPEQRERFLS